MAPEARDLQRLPRHRDVVGLQAARRRIEPAQPRLRVRGVAGAGVEGVELGARRERLVHLRAVPRVGRAPREVHDVGREGDGEPAPCLEVEPDDAVAAEARGARIAVREAAGHEERPPRGLVDARGVREARDGRHREGIRLELHLGAPHRRVDPELVDLAHRKREAATELDVRVAGRDLEPRRGVRHPQLGRVDRIHEPRLVVLPHDRVERGRPLRRVPRLVRPVVRRPPPVHRRIEPQPRRPVIPPQRRIDAVDPLPPPRVLVGEHPRIRIIGRRPRIEVLRHDRRIRHIELNRLPPALPTSAAHPGRAPITPTITPATTTPLRRRRIEKNARTPERERVAK